MTSDPNRLSAQKAPDDFVLSKVQFLVDIHLWPIRTHLDPHRWLNNFRATERPYALNILNVFLYLSNQIIDGMFRAALHSLSGPLTLQATSLANAKAIWHAFLSTVNVTYVQGEIPSPTDSGLLFARKARQVLNIPEEQITEPRDALNALVRNPSTPIVFVDDFLGSGSQMIATWTRKYQIDPGYETSFSDICERDTYVAYVPLVATRNGIRTLDKRCPRLTTLPVYAIDGRYSLLSTDSVLWPDSLRDNAFDVLYTASRRAGIVDNYELGWKGFRDFALAIAFEHSVPDATLPLVFWDQGG